MTEERPLKSPASDAELVPVEFAGFEFYRDPETGGHWFPHGELKHLFESQFEQELPPILVIDENTMHHSGRFSPETGQEMVEYVFADSGIKIEQCMATRGIWLDAGELKKLMSYVYEHTEEMSQADLEEQQRQLRLSDRLLLFLYQSTRRPPLV
ncbi:MAG: zf-TFIIB domain-containing protein [Chloroflexi bacterium]|nr:zf-TFIIB domain-containing protein [Chloroflexota bacterium]